MAKGQPTSWLERALCETAAHPHPETLETFRRHLDPAWIEQALELTGTMTLRKSERACYDRMICDAGRCRWDDLVCSPY